MSVYLNTNISIPQQFNTNTNYQQKVSFKAESDSFEKTTTKDDNKMLKTGAILSALALLGVAVWKHKAIGEFIEKHNPFKSTSENVSEKASEQLTTSLVNFRNLEEAKSYFESKGVVADFRGIGDAQLKTLDSIRDGFEKLKGLGVKLDKTDTLTISDWSKVDEMYDIYMQKGINETKDFLSNHTGYWARAQKTPDGKTHLFINSNKLNAFATGDILFHEMGHHARMAQDSVLASLNQYETLGRKKLEILDLPTFLAHKDIFENTVPEELRAVDDIILAAALNKNSAFEKNAIILNGKGITDLFKANVEKSYGYYDYQADEFVADIFKGLTTGKEYNDEVMLAYDFIGGGRIPNLKIKGQNYDDYIKSLYENQELVQKLRDRVEVGYIDDIVQTGLHENGDPKYSAVIKNFSDEQLRLLKNVTP